MNDRLYLSPPWQTDRELEAVTRALASNWIAPLGPDVDGFESDLCTATECSAALATSSGTAAIHLALLAVGVQPGDVVVAPSFTFIGTANPIVYVGAEPWFVDSVRETWNMDPDLVRAALSTASEEGRRVGAVIAVDLFGQCADYAALETVCGEFGVPLIEDAAEALGATSLGKPAGSFGTVGILSFNGNKIVTTSGGGAIVSDDEALVERCRHLATQARRPVVHYEHDDIGFNYRMSNVLAALGRAPARRARRTRCSAPAGLRRVLRSAGRRRGHLVHARGAFRSIESLAHDADGRSRAVRRLTARDHRGTRGPQHRGSARVEADAPSARVRGLPDVRRRRL